MPRSAGTLCSSSWSYAWFRYGIVKVLYVYRRGRKKRKCCRCPSQVVITSARMPCRWKRWQISRASRRDKPSPIAAGSPARYQGQPECRGKNRRMSGNSDRRIPVKSARTLYPKGMAGARGSGWTRGYEVPQYGHRTGAEAPIRNTRRQALCVHRRCIECPPFLS